MTRFGWGSRSSPWSCWSAASSWAPGRAAGPVIHCWSEPWGLGLLLMVASLVASDELNLRALAVALSVGGLLVMLGPRVVGSRQGRL